MEYAVVDIETTGGYAAAHGITEVAIEIHNGINVVDCFETLINPLQPIPIHIQALTGISNEMVANAPVFAEVAAKIFELLENRIFVAHNVNFDYSFLKHHLAGANYQLNSKKLCTVRLSRKIFPGFASYSLGKLCASLQISIKNRHRAGGDARATTILLGMLLEKDIDNLIGATLKKSSKEQVLPPNLQPAAIDNLPNSPGVYYFKNEKGKVIYVGKAKNVKKRVSSHFSGHNPNLQRQNFLKSIHQIDYQICATELMALILEAAEIKKYWPENNRAMKRYEQKYALYHFEDQQGYIRLGIDKFRKNSLPLYSFNNLLAGHQLLRSIVAEHQLCEKLCFIQSLKGSCSGHKAGTCFGACTGAENIIEYNTRARQAIENLQQLLPSFILIDEGRLASEKSCLLVENGKFYGMGYISDEAELNDTETLKGNITRYPSNDYIMNMIIAHGQQFPHKMLNIASLSNQ